MTTILKGDTSAEISVVIAEGYDYSGATVEIEYQGATRRFTGVSAGETVKYTLKAEETAVMALGAFPVRARVLGADGRVTTVSNKGAKIRVTDIPQEVYSDGVIAVDIRGGLYGISDLPARYTDKDVVAKIREILRKGGAVLCAALALSAFSASVTKTNKEDVYNDQGVVTDVDLSGLATEGFVNGKVNDVRTQAQTNAALIAENSAKIDAATALTPVYSDTPTFADWDVETTPATSGYSVYWEGGEWRIHKPNGGIIDTHDGDAFAVSLRGFDMGAGVEITAARLRTDVIGYMLGGDTNRILSAQAAVAELYSALTNALAGKIAKDGELKTQTLNGYLDIFGVLPDEESILRVGNSDSSYWVGLSRETINRRAYSDFYTYRLPNASGMLALTNDIPTLANWAKAANKPTYTAGEVGAIPTTGGVFNASLHLNQKLSVGTYTSNVKPIDSVGGSGIAFAFGDNVQTRAANTMVLGVGALNTNAWSLIWNGDANRMYFPTMPNQSNPYATRHNGGFHINPSIRAGMVNPLQNFWIGDTNLNDWIATLAPTPTWDTLSGKPTFATVATSGAYSDLSGKPTIPTTAADVGAVSLNGGRMNLGATLSFGPQGDGVDIYSGGIELSDTDEGHTESLFIDYNSITFTRRGVSTVYRFPLSASDVGALSSDLASLTNNATFAAAVAAVSPPATWATLSGKPTFATVATSGAYSDLSGTPTIPTVNDATLTFMQGTNTLGTFTANASANATITIPASDTAALEARMQVLESRAYIAIEGDAIYLVDPTENQ